MAALPTAVCRHFKFGFCRFKEHCRQLHVSESCSDESCEVEKCPKRHPKICRYYETYKRCKFTEYCLYSHKLPHEKEIVDLKVELKAVHDKVISLEKDIETTKVILNEKNKVIENLKIEVENVKKTPVPTTKELIGPILDTVNTSIKQSISVALEPVINNQIQSERRVNNLFSDLEAQVSQVLNQNTTNQQFKCELCRRTFSNQRSLENHIRTNHRPNQT